ncbi:hypothetical protein ACHQM5_025559 [Ranunculus cassubicifolius]
MPQVEELGSVEVEDAELIEETKDIEPVEAYCESSSYLFNSDSEGGWMTDIPGIVVITSKERVSDSHTDNVNLQYDVADNWVPKPSNEVRCIVHYPEFQYFNFIQVHGLNSGYTICDRMLKYGKLGHAHQLFDQMLQRVVLSSDNVNNWGVVQNFILGHANNLCDEIRNHSYARVAVVLDYWIKNVVVCYVRNEVCVHDSYWIPPFRWKHGDQTLSACVTSLRAKGPPRGV